MKIKNIFTFVAGSIVGSAITYFVVKKQYEEKITNEMQSLLNNLREKTKKDINETIDRVSKTEKKDYSKGLKRDISDINKCHENEFINSYKDIINNNGYGNEYSEHDEIKGPIVVSGEEVWTVGNDENYGFEVISLYYFEDKVLTDENYEPVTDIDNKVGKDFAKHFGEYDDNVVYIRNNERKVFYEILIKYEKYEDVKDKHYYE